jgi:hypothetical protein
VLLLPACAAVAGGGVLLKDDTCIVTIGFYTAHFTAYQPETRQSEQFCEDLPDTGLSVFVLDYLHDSLKEVPVDFRIVRNTTGLGEFARVEDVVDLGDLEAVTVAYRAPVIRPDARFQFEHEFHEAGEYIGIITAGHPTKNSRYTSVFPFTVGVRSYSWLLAAAVAAGLTAAALWFARSRRKPDSGRAADHGS